MEFSNVACKMSLQYGFNLMCLSSETGENLTKIFERHIIVELP